MTQARLARERSLTGPALPTPIVLIRGQLRPATRAPPIAKKVAEAFHDVLFALVALRGVRIHGFHAGLALPRLQVDQHGGVGLEGACGTAAETLIASRFVDTGVLGWVSAT